MPPCERMKKVRPFGFVGGNLVGGKIRSVVLVGLSGDRLDGKYAGNGNIGENGVKGEAGDSGLPGSFPSNDFFEPMSKPGLLLSLELLLGENIRVSRPRGT